MCIGKLYLPHTLLSASMRCDASGEEVKKCDVDFLGVGNCNVVATVGNRN